MKYIELLFFVWVPFVASKPEENLMKTNKLALQSRVINGDDASPNQFPYLAYLVLTKRGKTSECGGSIISEKHILTAAHCLYL